MPAPVPPRRHPSLKRCAIAGPMSGLRSTATRTGSSPSLPHAGARRALRGRREDRAGGEWTTQPARGEADRRPAEAGTVLVRPSGTERALRVMVDGPAAALVSKRADAIATLAGERLN